MIDIFALSALAMAPNELCPEGALETQEGQQAVTELRSLWSEGRARTWLEEGRAKVASYPCDARLRNAYGAMLNVAGYYPEALIHTNMAVRLRPGNSSYRYNRGLILAERGLFREAIADFDFAIADEPSRIFAYLERSAAYLSLGDINAARADLSTARHIAPDQVWIGWYEALQLMVLGDYENAIPLLAQVHNANPDFDPAIGWHLMAKALAGDPAVTTSDAKSPYHRSISEFHRHAISFDELIAVAMKEEQFGDARQVGKAWLHKAVKELGEGDHLRVQESLDQALAVNAPDHAWRLLAAALVNSSKPVSAGD